MNESDIHKMKLFCQAVIDKPLPLDEQITHRENGCLWCTDWRIIEICKYIFNGRDMYINDPPPNRLKNNPLWSKEAIMEEAESLMSVLKDADTMIDYFKHERDSYGKSGAQGIAGNT
jgi:hypothetical protein